MTDKKDFINISGIRIPCRNEQKNIHDLEYFSDNPRIASIIEKHDGKVTQEVIHDKLWDRNETHKLQTRIREDGGLIHPVLVHDKEVIEGNTRLCAYRELYKQTKNEKWLYINCRILDTSIDKKQLYRLLCNEHIVGKIDWDTYEKGNMLTKMKEQEGMDYEEIKKISKLSVSSIKQHIEAYKMMVKVNDTNTKRFSHYAQLVSNSEVKKIKKKKDPKIYDKIVTAIKSDQFHDAKNLRHVHEVYSDKKSKKRFFDEGEEFSQVFHDLKSTKMIVGSSFIRSISDITDRMHKLKRSEREEIKASSDGKFKVKKLADEIIKLCDEIGIHLHIPRRMR